MTTVDLPHKAYLLVCDGAKALFLCNVGNALRPQLSVERELHGDTARNGELASDRPGRMSTPAGPKSAMEPTDLQTLEEEAFVKNAVAEFEIHCRAHKVKQVIIAAPPKSLAIIRQIASKELMDRCVAQVAKDYVSHPMSDLVRLLSR
ncbi:MULTISPECIES: host attachment family protein [unclassified Beijerinckia]|uniref:host attachment family protein n=1 Tax=unclassified Beijerinckia TaxID=2638183 RepID=UPI000896CD54|nr:MULTISPECIES: host attachment family protein [unclassified Beijerinckia]MDH7794154.1 protein required for attachment to host cells [Beijerinckia sp. GAS462]SEB54524.1 Protein required for attachment to host cells [Beijerinckia sp. 28-YEA-48]